MSDLSSTEIQEIVDSLKQINDETHKMVMGIANGMHKSEIITMFNQCALDFFNTVVTILKTMGQEEGREIEGYMMMFQSALKYNINLPIDACAGVILKFAPEVYTENEQFFLGLHIPNAKVKDFNKPNQNSGFGIIESDKFKKLWRVGSSADKDKVKEKLIALTTWCHAYFFKLII